MGHTSPEHLLDVQNELNEIRQWCGVREKVKNIFYYKSKPFLHFHDKQGKRWADVRDGVTWGQPIDLPFDANVRQKQLFMREVERRYKKLETCF